MRSLKYVVKFENFADDAQLFDTLPEAEAFAVKQTGLSRIEMVVADWDTPEEKEKFQPKKRDERLNPKEAREIGRDAEAAELEIKPAESADEIKD